MKYFKINFPDKNNIDEYNKTKLFIRDMFQVSFLF